MTMLMAMGMAAGLAWDAPPPSPDRVPARTTICTALAEALSMDVADPCGADTRPWDDVPSLTGSGRMLALQDGGSPTPEASTTPRFGAKGSTRWTIKGQYGLQVSDTGNSEASIGLGMQWFIVDDFAFAPEVNLWGFFQEGEDAVGGSLDLMFQWHVLKGETWTIFGDFGCGLLGTNHSVPSDGSQFNFTPQAGVGATFDIGSDRRWVLGVKWHHISNASLYANNPGRDSVVIYTGLNLPF